jgi:hypothetical protein
MTSVRPLDLRRGIVFFCCVVLLVDFAFPLELDLGYTASLFFGG